MSAIDDRCQGAGMQRLQEEGWTQLCPRMYQEMLGRLFQNEAELPSRLVQQVQQYYNPSCYWRLCSSRHLCFNKRRNGFRLLYWHLSAILQRYEHVLLFSIISRRHSHSRSTSLLRERQRSSDRHGETNIMHCKMHRANMLATAFSSLMALSACSSLANMESSRTERQLGFVVTCSKQKIRVGEPLRLSAMLVNNRGTPVRIDGRLLFRSHLRVMIKDAAGRIYPYDGWNLKVRLAPCKLKDISVVAAGCHYGRGNFSRELVSIRKPGVYNMFVSLNTNPTANQYSEKGHILSVIVHSRPIKVEVVP